MTTPESGPMWLTSIVISVIQDGEDLAKCVISVGYSNGRAGAWKPLTERVGWRLRISEVETNPRYVFDVLATKMLDIADTYEQS